MYRTMIRHIYNNNNKAFNHDQAHILYKNVFILLYPIIKQINLLVTNRKAYALIADPTPSRHHKDTAVTTRILQMDHNEIFFHWVNGFSKLHSIIDG